MLLLLFDAMQVGRRGIFAGASGPEAVLSSFAFLARQCAVQMFGQLVRILATSCSYQCYVSTGQLVLPLIRSATQLGLAQLGLAQ